MLRIVGKNHLQLVNRRHAADRQLVKCVSGTVVPVSQVRRAVAVMAQQATQSVDWHEYHGRWENLWSAGLEPGTVIFDAPAVVFALTSSIVQLHAIMVLSWYACTIHQSTSIHNSFCCPAVLRQGMCKQKADFSD